MRTYDFFISYSSKDPEPIRICNELERRGVSCWIAPRDIPRGTPYARAIMQGIEHSDIFLVFISSNSIASDDVLNEIDNAHRLRKHIIPIFISPVNLSYELSYYLSRKQWINLFEGESISINHLIQVRAGNTEPATPISTPSADIIGLPPFDREHMFSLIDSPKTKSRNDDFVFTVEDVFEIKGRGVVVTGKVESGMVSVGDNVAIIGEDKRIDTILTGIEIQRKLLDSAVIGDECGLLLSRLSSAEEVKRGYILYTGARRFTTDVFCAGVYLLGKGEGISISVNLSVGDTVTLYNRTNNVKATILRMSQTEAQNGDFLSMELKLDKKIYIEDNDTFALQQKKKTIGCGVVYNLSV